MWRRCEFWLQVNRLSCVYIFVVRLHLVPFSSLHPWITHVNYGTSKTPTKLQIPFFFLQPPPHCLLSIWSLSMVKHLAHHPIMILQKLCQRGNTRLLIMLSLKSILQALQNKVNVMSQKNKNERWSGRWIMCFRNTRLQGFVNHNPYVGRIGKWRWSSVRFVMLLRGGRSF